MTNSFKLTELATINHIVEEGVKYFIPLQNQTEENRKKPIVISAYGNILLREEMYAAYLQHGRIEELTFFECHIWENFMNHLDVTGQYEKFEEDLEYQYILLCENCSVH